MHARGLPSGVGWPVLYGITLDTSAKLMHLKRSRPEKVPNLSHVSLCPQTTQLYREQRQLDGKPPYYRTLEQPDVWFRPHDVWEIRGADLTVSPVHAAAAGLVHPTRGISMRFPRMIKVGTTSLFYVSGFEHVLVEAGLTACFVWSLKMKLLPDEVHWWSLHFVGRSAVQVKTG